jgi:hypothetical protein
MNKILGIVLLSCLYASSSSYAVMRDPTMPPYYKGSSAVSHGDNSFNVSSIIYGNGRKVAIINGSIIREGELLKGATVLAITSNTVTLKKGKKTMALHLVKPLAIKLTKNKQGEVKE